MMNSLEVMLEEFRGAAVGQLGGVLVEVDAAVAGKGMTATGIDEHLGEAVAGEGSHDGVLRILRDVFVLLAEVNQQRTFYVCSFIQVLLGITSVEDDRCVRAATSRGQKGHQSAEAISQQSDLASRPG